MHAPAVPGALPRRLVLIAFLLAASLVLVALNEPARAAALSQGASEAAASSYRLFLNLLLGPARVGVQIGHLDSGSHPDELARLRASTGGVGGGLLEVEVNQAVALALASRLQALGLVVDLLPATVPPGYRADLVVAVHADSSPAPHRRGYKSAVFLPARNRWDESLKRALDEAYLAGSGLPDDDGNVTGDMLEYYAFNRHYRHSLARSTPAVIVELGYLSHPLDRELLGRPDRVAEMLERGLLAFLAERGRLSAF
jgi:hypothetical protein